MSLNNHPSEAGIDVIEKELEQWFGKLNVELILLRAQNTDRAQRINALEQEVANLKLERKQTQDLFVRADQARTNLVALVHQITTQMTDGCLRDETSIQSALNRATSCSKEPLFDFKVASTGPGSSLWKGTQSLQRLKEVKHAIDWIIGNSKLAPAKPIPARVLASFLSKLANITTQGEDFSDLTDELFVPRNKRPKLPKKQKKSR
jgi:hypothetical protein